MKILLFPGKANYFYISGEDKMASKSKDVRIEQRRILEKKLELRLSKLAGLGVASEKAKSDPLVKNLKSQIRETNVRIAAFDKNTVKIQELKQAKEKKLAEKSAPKEEQAAPEKEAKAKKKAVPAEKEPKKKPAEGEAPKKPRKKKEEAPAE
ncbi:MAG: hypothetical protein CVU71_09425 [Deltaproteobacteria bacterium HGW-Deltaproteobacteria-6]|jgi:FtsZ-interacting cell division protein ZipA|nr:MAG: hypothetical protein CVU71_09425 [Deltaproteobacteria bacterium HGW-Deltaproteobacteria-6]